VTKIIIEKSGLAGADQLATYLENRLAEIVWHDELNASSGDNKFLQHSGAFVCAKHFADENGGVSGVTEIARSIKAGRVLIIAHEAGSGFNISSEMKGNLIHLNMASADMQAAKLEVNCVNNYSLQMAASLVLDNAHVAVSDTKSLELMALAKRVSKTDVTVFINGPTGTGKEVLAKFIHNQSGRIDAPFVAVNCAAIPENMLEAILFGHEKGAFTGASTANKGIFRAADGGTLLLDEISEMPLGLQAKLLRALQERKVTPLGSQREIDVDVRVVATTNRNMLGEVKEGRFREDLFYRLNVFPLASRHLHERKNDIVAISTILLKRHAAALGSIPALADDAIELLLNYGWPGNVRELENVLQRALVLCSDNIISAADIMVDGTVMEQLTSSRMMQAQQDSALPA
jgi:two-component system, response regulator FlrC